VRGGNRCRRAAEQGPASSRWPHLAVAQLRDPRLRSTSSSPRPCARPRPMWRRMLVIAGDPRPAGRRISQLDRGDRRRARLQRHGITEIGIAGYPDGHPRISAAGPRPAPLADKIQAAETTGIAVHIVTQFCFDASAILKMDCAACARLRHRASRPASGLARADQSRHPVCATPQRLRACARRRRGLARQAGLVRQLFALSAPDALVAQARRRARAERHLGEIAPHFFSFGGPSRAHRALGASRSRAPHRHRRRGEGFQGRGRRARASSALEDGESPQISRRPAQANPSRDNVGRAPSTGGRRSQSP